jgi:hypothetical protein
MRTWLSTKPGITVFADASMISISPVNVREDGSTTAAIEPAARRVS